MLVLKMLARNWRGGELKLLSLALVLAVAVLSGIAIFTERLQLALTAQGNSLLGADYVVRGSLRQSDAWDAQAQAAGISTSRAAQFSSMVYAGSELQLAAVKAVASGYPLRGHFEVSRVPFALKPEDIEIAKGIPAPGEVWVDSRLLPLLHIQLGDQLEVGEKSLKVTELLISEPDGVSQLSLFGARVLMNIADLDATQVVQPGSRVDYLWLLASDDQAALKSFVAALKPQLGPHQRLLDIATAQARMGRTLDAGKKYLLLAAVIALLLGGVAIALSATQFAHRHTDQVALMKSLGLSRGGVRTLYLGQLLLLGVLASLVGLCAGQLLQWIMGNLLEHFYHLRLGSASRYPYLLSLVSGLLCLLSFALPALWFLPGIPPLKILRRELSVRPTHAAFQVLMAALAIMILVILFGRDWRLALSVIAALVLVALATGLAAFGLLWLGRLAADRLGGYWRLAFASLVRRRGQTLLQILVFAVAAMLLLSLTLVRGSLISDWQSQVPDRAPNHFLVNIPAAELAAVEQLLREAGAAPQVVYPVVRGRLVRINDRAVEEHLRWKSNALRRELNLTQARQLGADNKLISGAWWDSWHNPQPGLRGISVEQKTAEELGLKLGDRLGFSIGALDLEAQVASIRSLDWRSMNPNFFFIFEPESLDQFSPTYMTSIYLAPEQKLQLNRLLREHPTLVVIELDRIIDQIQGIISQVSNGVLLVLALTLIGGVLVLWSAVEGSMEVRRQEAGLVRALGGSRLLVQGSITAEFALLGAVAGAIAVLGAELLLFGLQTYVLHVPIQAHYSYWLITPAGTCVLISALGYLACRPVLQTPPAIVLRAS